MVRIPLKKPPLILFFLCFQLNNKKKVSDNLYIYDHTNYSIIFLKYKAYDIGLSAGGSIGEKRLGFCVIREFQ